MISEEQKVKLREALPPNLNIRSVMEYPDITEVKVRGTLGEFAVLIAWNYVDSPEECYLETIGINSSGVCTVLPLDELKYYNFS